MAQLLPQGKQYYETAAGIPLVGGKLYTFDAGTNTPRATYSDAAGATPNANPVILDARGEATIYWVGNYKVVLRDSLDSIIWTQDNVSSIAPPPSGSLIPTQDNAFDLGSPAFAWRNVYVGTDGVPVFDSASGNVGYYRRTDEEIAQAVTPVNYSWPPGTPERYGALSTYTTVVDDTAAIVNCFKCNAMISFRSRVIYGVTTFTIDASHNYVVYWNGASIRGIATVPTTCVMRLKINGTAMFDVLIDLRFNENYTCGTWWYDDTASSQYNALFGCNHIYGRRGMIYGELPGNTSTAFAQSENAVYGWRTRGIQNPFYGNHTNGVIFFSQPIFVALAEEWPAVPTFNLAASRAVENRVGTLCVTGGELQLASTNLGFAADLANTFWDGGFIEVSEPIQIVGNDVHISGARALMGRDDQSLFKIGTGVTGRLTLSDTYFTRSAGVGAYSAICMVDDSAAASTFRTVFNNTESFEWRWSLLGGNVRLTKSGIAVFNRHRLSITAADLSVYVLDNCANTNLLDGLSFDRLGYTTTGWNLFQDFGAGTTLTVSTATGPAGYLASQIQLAAPTTQQAIGTYGNPNTVTLTNLKASALKVRPGELYWCSAWANNSAGTGGKLLMRFYTLTGTVVGDVNFADSGSIPAASWSFIEGPVTVPATAAYAVVGALCNGGGGITNTILVTDLQCRRAA